MYLGKPHTIERDGDGATGYSNMIFIVNPQTHEILDYITLDNVIDDNHKLNLETYLQTYDAIVLGGGRYDKYLEKRNRVIIPDEDGTLQEFVLFEVDKYRDTEGRKTHFYAHASYLELKKANIIYPNKYESLTASQLGGIALNDTGWQIGQVEASGTRTMTIENHTSPYEFIKRIAREFEVELRFRVETDGQRITGRYVDLLERIGEWRGRQVEFGRDLDGIRRIEKQDIVTALLGLGPEQEDGTRLEVLVEDEDALQRWGRVDEHGNLHHLIEPYEIESSRTEMTETEARQYTRTALDKRINTQVAYETTVVDLEEVPGMSNKKIRFGDTIRIKDTHFNPPLSLEARVYEMTRSLKHKAKKDIKLGDYIEYTEEEVSAVFNQLRNEIRRKVSMAQVREYAEPKIIESPTPPPIESGENAKWIDTSGEIKVPHVVIGDEWVKMSPTEHDISDADRLSSGIIDVGQVPLRTSVSGARIEWDGVNGLVQYDANNDVVTHLSLDGDATFSGHLEGATGTFGEVTAVDGDFFFEDSSSEMKYGVTPKTNLIVDHSFELVRPIGNAGSGGYWTNWESDEWLKSGSPRLFSYYGTDVATRWAFGYQYIGVNNSNYVYMDLYEDVLTAGKTFTFSCHFANYTGSPSPRLRARLMRYTYATEATTTINTWDQTFASITEKGKLQRHSITLTLPSDFNGDESKYFEWIEFSIMSGNSSWLIIDGVQVVEGSYPTLYEEEGSLWSLMNGLGTVKSLSVSSLALSNASGARNNLSFPSGHIISEGSSSGDWYFYGNRASGRNPFVVRSHNNRSSYRNDFWIENDGRLYSPQWYSNTSSNTANVRVNIPSSANHSGGTLYRVTSSRKYKLLEEEINFDPYQLLDVMPKTWYDKGNIERHAEELTRKSKGENYTADVEIGGLKRIAGLIAEDVVDAGLDIFVERDSNDEIQGIQYERLWTLLIPIVRDLKERIDEIESKCKCGR